MDNFTFPKDPGCLPAIVSTDAVPEALEPGSENDELAAAALKNLLRRTEIRIDEIEIEYDDGIATIFGRAKDQRERERAILVVGNAPGVKRVRDGIRLLKPEPRSAFYTVKDGDTLEGIALSQYGDPDRMDQILWANEPLITCGDDVVPGQVLRLPPVE